MNTLEVPISWRPDSFVYSFAQLEHLREQGMLETEQLNGHGVYLISRRFVPTGIKLSDSGAFAQWFSRALTLPAGTLRATLREHFATGTLKIDLGVSDLSGSKSTIAEDAAFDADLRRLFRLALASVPPVVLYCGETSNFRLRICQHLDGSEAWIRLADAGYDTRDLEFRAIPLPPVPNHNDPTVVEVRRTLERVIAQLTLSPFTDRPG